MTEDEMKPKEEEIEYIAPRCANEQELNDFFNKHSFVGEVSHSYLDWQSHQIVTEQDNIIYE